MMRKIRRYALKSFGLFVLLCMGAMRINAATPIYVAVHGGSQPGIWKLEDINGDNDALDRDERQKYAGAPTAIGFMDVAVDAQGILYAIAEGISKVYRIKDLNNDGDALDSGEVTVFRDVTALGLGISGPISVAVADFYDAKLLKNRTWVYVMDVQHQLTMRLEDIDNDGDAQSSYEYVVIQQTTGEAPFTANQMIVDEVGRIVGCNANNKTIVRITDINLDSSIEEPRRDDPCPPPGCGSTGNVEFHVIRRKVSGQQNLINPFGVAINSQGDYFVTDDANNEPMIIKLSDLNGDDDALDSGEFSTYYFSTIASKKYDLAVDQRDVIYVAETGATEAMITRVEDQNGDGDAFDPGDFSLYADFTGIGTPVGLAIQQPLPGPMDIQPELTDASPLKGPLLVVEDGTTVSLKLRVFGEAVTRLKGCALRPMSWRAVSPSVRSMIEPMEAGTFFMR